jgi:hypothetical protein
MYKQGRGVPQSFVHAYFWLNLCSASSTPGELRSTAIQQRDEVAMALTPAQLDQAQVLASEWQPRMDRETFDARVR